MTDLPARKPGASPEINKSGAGARDSQESNPAGCGDAPGQHHFPKLADIQPGDKLIADGGFTCLREGEIVIVEMDGCGDLFVRCAGPDEDDNADADYGKPSTDKREERHGLDGQENEDGQCVGLERAP